MSESAPTPEAAAITRGPNYHFFGYYDRCPWSPDGELVVALETVFQDRAPEPHDIAMVGLVHLGEQCRWEPLTETAAWNWQQGAMQQWLNVPGQRLLVHNVRRDDGYAAVVHDLNARASRPLPRPVYHVSHDGRQAVTLNFSRVHRLRPGYGYNGIPDTGADDPEPAEDGLWWMDLETGEHRLIVSIAEIARHERTPDMDGGHHWFNHLQFNADGSRIVFLHRWYRDGEPGWGTRMFTVSPDGSDLCLLNATGRVSHFDWRDESHILAYSQHPDGGEQSFYLYTDRSDEVVDLRGDMLPTDGHCSFSPDRQWILNDAYPRRDRGQPERPLYIYHIGQERRYDLGRYYSPPELDADYRCDLHPRWNRDGTWICFDSAHEHSHRQVYVMDVRGIVRG